MATVYIDNYGTWRLKTKVNGKDARIRLRKASAGETSTNKPPDVLELAAQHTAPKPAKKPISRPCKTAKEPESQSGPAKKPISRPCKTAMKPDQEPEPNPNSLLEWIDWFEKDYGKGRAAGSLIRMSRILRRFRQFIGKEDRPIKSIDYATMKAFFDWQLVQKPPKGKTLLGRTVVSDVRFFQGLFKPAITRGFISRNPCCDLLKEVTSVYPESTETKYLDLDQIRTALMNIDEAVANGKCPIDYADIIRIMLSTGLRVSAAINLRWEWITSDWRINVPYEFSKTKCAYTTGIAPMAKEVLMRRKTPGSTGRVFPEGITRDGMGYRIRRWCGINSHRCRHSFATMLMDNNVPIEVISSLLGHRDLRTTQRYAIVRDQAKLSAVATLKF